MTASELEQMMVEAFGPDFREKAIVGPVGSFQLRDVFEECGLEDPRKPSAPIVYGGLLQFDTSPIVPRELAFDPMANAKAALRRYRNG